MSLIDREAAKAAVEPYLTTAPWLVYDPILAALDALPAADDGRPKNFMLYVEQEAKRTGVDPLTVLANEWAAHSKLKDESLWPDQSKLAAFAPRPKEAGE